MTILGDTAARLRHPWLRINRVLRAMLHERWSAEAWPQSRPSSRRAIRCLGYSRAKHAVVAAYRQHLFLEAAEEGRPFEPRRARPRRRRR